MHELYKQTVLSQFEAALVMLRQCIDRCPETHWDDKIANGSFREVAYHTLFFVDFYLSKDEAKFELGSFTERGGDEREPVVSPGLSKADTLAYSAFCRQKLCEEIAAETAESLAGPSGISFRHCTRAELHIYNMRHVQHHTGALSAFLRKLNVELDWIGQGWRE